MGKTAILIDGGFYRKRAKHLWGKQSAADSAEAMIRYCRRHLREHNQQHELYRIFYYDCPPVDKQMFHPLHGKTVNMKVSEEYVWMQEFLTALREKRKVALRLGSLDTGNAVFTLAYEATKQICNGTLAKDGLCDHHFAPTIGQKGVDMKLGIDIASLAYKKQVDQIVLIAGDSDFVPAAKLARREGIDIVLDPMGMQLSPDRELLEHIDGKRSCGNPFQTKNDPEAPNG